MDERLELKKDRGRHRRQGRDDRGAPRDRVRALPRERLKSLGSRWTGKAIRGFVSHLIVGKPSRYSCCARLTGNSISVRLSVAGRYEDTVCFDRAVNMGDPELLPK